MVADLLNGCILEVRFYAVYFAGRKIDATHVRAVILAIDVFIRVRLFPGAFRYGGNIVIASGGVVIRNEPAAQLADHFPFFDSYGGKQAVTGIGNRRFLYDRPLIVLFVYLEKRRLVGRFLRGQKDEAAGNKNCSETDEVYMITYFHIMILDAFGSYLQS